MDKETLSNYGWIVICVLVLAVMIALATPFGNYIKDAVWSTTQGLFDVNEKALNVAGMSATQENPELSKIASVILDKRYHNGIPAKARAVLSPYCYISVNPGTTVNLTNNSTDYNVALHPIKTTTLDLDFDPGWCSPGNSQSVSLSENVGYISLYFSRVDGKAFDTSDINLEDYVVTYDNDTENLLNLLPAMVAAYNNSFLKNYNPVELSTYLNSVKIVAHAGGEVDGDIKNTMTAISNAVENMGFAYIEVDIQRTADGEIILAHDLTISGLKIKNSTYADLKAVKSNLATLAECLEYCSAKNVFVYLDVKDNGSKEYADYLTSLLQQYNMENSFAFERCPDTLLNNLTKYQDINYTIQCKPWDNSYIGNNHVRYSTVDKMYIHKLINALQSGQKRFQYFDMTTNGYDNNPATLVAFTYLVYSNNGDFYLTLFKNSVPDISSITEQELLRALPKDIWELTGLVQISK